MANPTTKRTAKFKPHVAATIIQRLSEGETLKGICRDEGMPSHTSVLCWVNENPTFAAEYARARTDGFDVIAQEIIEIADNTRQGEKIERKEVGRVCSLCQRAVKWHSAWKHVGDSPETLICAGAVAIPVMEEKTVTGDMIERSRLQVDARKWLLSKLRPDKYGDRVAMDVSGNLGLSVADILRQREEKLNPDG
jgi:hypothetical protein